MKEKNPAIVSDVPLIRTGKSRRLSVIANKTQQQNTPLNNQSHSFVTELKSEKKAILQQANSLIEQRIIEILDAYPAGKKNTFFKLKYGVSVEAINKMPMKKVFPILHVKTTEIQKFAKIENLDASGKIVVS